MIKVYPIKIEAVDTNDESQVLFTLESFDDECASLTIDQRLVFPDKLDELFAAIRKGVELLDLKPTNHD